MKTRTAWYTYGAQGFRSIERMEGGGWRVRQLTIVYMPDSDPDMIVVYEREGFSDVGTSSK